MSGSNRWREARRTGLIAMLVMSLLLLAAGCSMARGEDKPLPVRDVSVMEGEVSSLSNRVLEMFKVKGKVTEPGPSTTACSGDGGKAVWVIHPWSMYGIDNSKLGEAFSNLKRSLPEQGWKIVKDGDDGSRNKNPEVLAVHRKTRSQLEIRWLKGLDGNTPLLDVNVYSKCFKKAD
ncbi:hypothetical protein [Streptomyces sp. NPDC050560]|uniref:hypothetical protein n=1 Tax=Streptomyces sp. NPDC050560 TaxID=3365630 RepID=UPI003791E06A